MLQLQGLVKVGPIGIGDTRHTGVSVNPRWHKAFSLWDMGTTHHLPICSVFER